MKKLYYLLCATLLGTLLLAGCSSNDGDTENEDESNSSEQQHDNKADKQDEADQGADQDDTQKGQDQDSATGTTNDKTEAPDNKNEASNNEDASSSMNETFKMNDSKIKQPTRFPSDYKEGNSSLNENKSNLYAIDYKSDSNQKIATFKGTQYKSKQAAADSLNEFMDGKAVPAPGGNETDLGHGITGYGEGAAGHAYFSWEEGNWTFSISSLTADKMDNPAIAKKMVDYLEDHLLPPPKDTGIVYVDYPKDGNSVDVDIRWQENKMVYQIETNEVPLDALEL